MERDADAAVRTMSEARRSAKKVLALAADGWQRLVAGGEGGCGGHDLGVGTSSGEGLDPALDVTPEHAPPERFGDRCQPGRPDGEL
jgi:hypothetical protein